MQLVSRKVLFDVMKHRRPVKFKSLKGLNEDETDVTTFDTFMFNANELCKIAEVKTKAMLDKYTQTKYEDEFMYQFYMQIMWFMEKNKDVIKYVNEGSSRVVFALADGTALKVAKTPAGIAQNKTEIINCMNPLFKYAIFPDFYAADKRKWIALNCELCASTNDAEFKRLLKADVEKVVNLAKRVVMSKLDYEEFMAKTAADDRELPQATLEGLIACKTEAFKALDSLVKFWKKNGLDTMLASDLKSVANWGVTVRDNQLVPVVVDAGFSKQVANDYYTE